MGTKISELTAVSSLAGTEILVGVQGTTTKRMTAAQLAAYAVDTVAAAAAADPTAGDKLLAFRDGTEKLEDLDDLAAYMVASGWTVATETDLVAAGDMLLISRSGTIYKLDVDTLTAYVLTGVQASSLDISGLNAATLGSTDQYLVVQGSTAKKTTLADIETKLWADRKTYVSALTAATAGADADLLYLLQSGAEKTITLDLLADYVEAEIKDNVLSYGFDADVVTPALTGDLLALERSGVRKTATVDTVAAFTSATLGASTAATSYLTGDSLLLYRDGAAKLGTIDLVSDFVQTDLWNATTVTTLVAGDTVLLGRSGATDQITVANLAAGIRSDVLNFSGLSTATLGSTDQILVVQTTTPKKTTLADLETKLFADTVSHVGGLTAVSAVTDSDIFHTNQGGTEKKVTPVELATYMATAIGSGVIGTAFDSSAVVSITSGDLLLLERSGTRKTGTVDLLAAYTSGVLEASGAVTPATGDKLLVYRSGTAQTADIDLMAAYVTPAILGSATVTTTLDTDTVILGRSGATKQITFANLQTEILDGIQATVLNISALDAATLGATDEYLVCQSGVATKTTLSALETKLWADFATYAGALTDAVAVTDSDKIYLLNGTTPKAATGTEVATYVNSQIWDAPAAESALTGDKLALYRTGTGMLIGTVDMVSDFVTAGIQAEVLDISALTEATIAPADLVLICQAGEGKQASVEDLTAEVHDKLAAYIGARNAVTSLVNEDVMLVIEAGTPKRTTLSEVVDFVISESTDPGWTTVTSSKYTSTPADTSTITMSDTSDMVVGLPVKYTYNSVVYYGLVTAVSANASVTIAGAPLDVGYPVSELCVGKAERVVQVELQVNSIWDDAVQDLLAEVEERYFKWQKADAYLVAFSGTQHWVDSGASQPYVNVKVNGNLVGTDASNKGIQLSGTAGTWVDSGAVAISAANYAITRGQSLELRCTQTGTTGDAECLTVSCVFVLE